MKQYVAGEVLLLSFPFTNVAGAKRRPALVLVDTGDEDIVVARVTSQVAQTVFDVEVVDWKRANLLFPSVVRVHKIATLEKRLVERKLGKLTRRDWVRVQTVVHQFWSSI